jgi:hypothetical protein
VGKIPLNFDLLRNPANWIIIGLMVYIIGLAISLIFHKQVIPSPE